MTHDELLNDIGLCLENNYTKFLASALRAAVELHKPKAGMVFTSDLRCNICYEISQDGYDFYDVSYPCPTIQAIERELS